MTGRITFAAIALSATLSLGQAAASPKDLDGDGISNRLDSDVDGDGLKNGKDRNVDGGICRKGSLKGKFVGDALENGDSREKDIDGDGLADESKTELDIDGDRRPDAKDDDIDGDGRRNGLDDDCDGDGKGRANDDDDDGDGTDDRTDPDDDNDQIRDADENEVSVLLTATAAAPVGSRVQAKVELSADGEIELEFDGRNLAAGDYEVMVDGRLLGVLSMINNNGRTEGEVEFESGPNKTGELLLPFNPFGLPVLIVKSGVTYFSGIVPTPSDVFVDDDEDDDEEDDDDGDDYDDGDDDDS